MAADQRPQRHPGIPARAPAARLRAFRGVTRLPAGDEYALVALLEDYAAYPDWLHFVDGARPWNGTGRGRAGCA
ncbi:hypothetical protein HML84_19210 [Alcanivorax sp. IO_7]|nr:hypothetical protein HML84_19210 [Alcanivorax sp. IO_7]